MDVKKMEMLVGAFISESAVEHTVFAVSNEENVNVCRELEQSGYLEETFGFTASDGKYYEYFIAGSPEKGYKLTDKGRDYCKHISISE